MDDKEDVDYQLCKLVHCCRMNYQTLTQISDQLDQIIAILSPKAQSATLTLVPTKEA